MLRTFHDQIAENRRNSAFLVTGFVLLTCATFFVFALLLGGGDPKTSVAAAAVGLGIAGGIALWGANAGPSALLSMSRARAMKKQDDPELWNVVEELSIASGLPMPAVYSIDDAAPNAFATGRGADKAAQAAARRVRRSRSRPVCARS